MKHTGQLSRSILRHMPPGQKVGYIETARNLTLLFLTVTLFLLAPLTACNEQQTTTARVTDVIDGDTIVIGGGDRVRYIGVDSPERGEEYYQEASEANRELVQNKRVRLEKDITDRDRYGRLLRYVYTDDYFVNAEMVRRGYAQSKAYPPDIKYQVYLESMEREARQEGRGIWK